MKHKRNLKETSVYVNDDFTPLRAKITRDLRSKNDVRGVLTAIEKIIVFMQDNQELVIDNIYKLQKWDNELFSNACKSLKKCSLWNFGISDKIFNTSGFFLSASLLLKKCGDIEENPGPEICYGSFSSCLWNIKRHYPSFTWTFKV